MEHWNLVRANAQTFFENRNEFSSLGGNVQYRIIGVTDKVIRIKRLNGGEVAQMGYLGVNNAIEHLINSGTIFKEDFINSVARQTALVVLHPNVKYDEVRKVIYWEKNAKKEKKISQIIDEADDDELVKVDRRINQRLYQSKFRKNILNIYDNKCAISGCTIERVLEACHIYTHSKTGNNSSKNGILLRSDLHRLFDADLILIHPKSLKVVLHPSLHESEYIMFENLSIKILKDKKEFLEKKWAEIDWVD